MRHAAPIDEPVERETMKQKQTAKHRPDTSQIRQDPQQQGQHPSRRSQDKRESNLRNDTNADDPSVLGR